MSTQGANAGTTIIKISDVDMITIGLDSRLDAERNHVSLPSQSSSHHNLHASTRTSTTNTPWLRHRPLFSKQILLLIVITCFLSLSSASVYISEQMVEVREDVPVPDTFDSTIARLARSGTILVDQRPPPQPQDWRLSNINDDLRRRDLHDVEVRSVSSSSTSSASKGQSTASTLASTTTSGGIAAATSTGPVSLPTPFDVGFSSNITTNCQSFMTNMLNNATFKACLPFSLLLQVCLHSLNLLPQFLTSKTEFQLFLPNLKIHPPHNTNPRLHLRRELHTMRLFNDISSLKYHF